MRTLFAILTTILFTASGFAQNGFYIGYENGGLFDKFHYNNSKGYALSQTSIGGVLGGYVGYKHNSYNLEMGFYGYQAMHPFVTYDYDSGIPTKSFSMGSGAESWAIPIRLGKEFTFSDEKLFLSPMVSFNTIICSDYSENQPTMGWGENVSPFPNNPNYISLSSDSTRAYGYIASKVNFGIETGLSAGYRFKKKTDIYVKGSYLTYINPIYYETISHYSETETVNATQVGVHSFLLQIGLRYYFAKREE